MVKEIGFLLLILLVACNPLNEGQEGSYKDEDYTPGLNRTPFKKVWDFDRGNSGAYIYPGNVIELSSGELRLSPSDQVDDDDASSGFGGGSFSGVYWDNFNGYLRLDQSGSGQNTTILDPIWTPRYAKLVGYWPLDGESTLSNGTMVPGQVGPSLTAVNPGQTLEYSAGQVLQSINMNGGAYLNAGSSSGLDISNALTVAAWVYNSSGTNGHIINRGGGWGDPGYSMFWLSGSIRIELQRPGLKTIVDNIAPSAGAWHHIAFTWDNVSNTIKVYIDGVQAPTTGIYTGSIGAPSQDLCIGYNQKNAFPFSGKIDEVAIWKEGLSAEEIALIYKNQSVKYSGSFTSRVMEAFNENADWTRLKWVSTIPFEKALAANSERSSDYDSLSDDLMTDIAGFWHLDEAAGTNGAESVKESSGIAAAGTPIGSYTWSSQGRLNRSLLLSGSGYVEISESPSLNISDALTISTWVKVKSFNKSWQSIVTKGDSSYRLQRAGTSNSVSFGTAGLSNVELQGTTSINDGRWHHLVAIYGGAADPKKYLYIDGKLETSIAVTGSLSTNSFNLAMGENLEALGRQWNGDIDEVAIWQRALTPLEVSQLYRRGSNRIKFQVRLCSQSDCSDDPQGASWKGPDGTNQTYFSELNNNTLPIDGSGEVLALLPSMEFSQFNYPPVTARYFQYRTILESDDIGQSCDYGSGPIWCSPELRSVSVGPFHYDAEAPSVVGLEGVTFHSLSRFTETLGGDGCSSGVVYNLGVGEDAASARWLWWNGTNWESAQGSSATANAAPEIEANLKSFTFKGKGKKAFFRAFLRSTGSSSCSLDKIQVSGQM